MRNQAAAVSRRLSDPDFQGALVNRCILLTLGMGAVLCASLLYDAWMWTHPVPPRYFFTDGKHAPRPVVALDSPIVDDTQLLDWTVQAILAPYNVDYYNYPVQLNTASRRFTLRGWNTSPAASSTRQFRRAEACAAAVSRAVAARGRDPSDQLRPGRARLPDPGADHPDLRERQPDQHEQSDDYGARHSHE